MIPVRPQRGASSSDGTSDTSSEAPAAEAAPGPPTETHEAARKRLTEPLRPELDRWRLSVRTSAIGALPACRGIDRMLATASLAHRSRLALDLARLGCRRVARYFTKSGDAWQRLQEDANAAGVPVRAFATETVTRWNSTFDLIASAPVSFGRAFSLGAHSRPSVPGGAAAHTCSVSSGRGTLTIVCRTAASKHRGPPGLCDFPLTPA